jgi:hypothetical protein
MKIVIPTVVAQALVIGIGLASAVLCQTTVEFGITSPGSGSNVLSGVYTDPYQGYVESVGGAPGAGGTAVAAFCDDFTDDVSPPQFWTAYDTDLSALSNANAGPVSSVYYGDYSPTMLSPALQTQDYIAVAMLAVLSMENTGNVAVQNQLSFALWDIFDPTLLNSPTNAYGTLDSTDYEAAIQYASNALTAASAYSSGAAYESTSGYDVQIYTPETGGLVDDINSGRPQEFVTVEAMVEPSTWASLCFDFVGLIGVAGLAFRRQLRNKS